MEKRTEIIILCGPESTGKTSLARELSGHYKTVWIPEYAREYVDKLSSPYSFDDVEIIAKQQLKQYNDALKSDREFIFMDTFLIITKVWFNEVYKRYPDWIDAELKGLKPGLFLLCNYDLPWTYDPLRENMELRPYLFEQYRKELEYYNFSYKIVSGEKTDRLEQAVRSINNYYYD